MKSQKTHKVPLVEGMPRTTMQMVWGMVKPYRTGTIWFFLLSFVGMLAWTASPFVIGLIVTKLTESHGISPYVWWLVGLYFVLRLIDEIFWRISDYIMRDIKPNMVESVRLRLFTAAMKRPYSFFVDSSSGRIGHWINQTCFTINEFIDTTIWNVWPRVTSMIFSAVFLAFIHWSIALIFVVWLVGLFTYNVYRGKKFSQLIAKQSDEASIASGIVVDSVANHVSVRVFGSQQNEEKLLLSQQQKIISTWRQSWMQNLVTNIAKGQSASIVSAVTLALVISLYGNGTIAVGAIVVFVAYFGDASSSLWQLAWSLDSYYRNFGTIQNALDGLSGDDERMSKVLKRDENLKNAHLMFQNVTFAYPDLPENHILKGIDLDIKPGEKVGVVGHSGAGKSTLVGLLLGFYEPTAGQIMYGGNSMKEFGPAFIREHASFVPQDTNLFNRTVRENVVYGRPNATDEEIEMALKQSETYNFIQKLPNGLDTIIGERGVKLSGGQRQRIAIARAILQDAPLLILDEATSALDSVSEQAIQKALYGLMQDRTSLVIAHRLSTLKHLDRIIILNEGSIAEQGSHQQLLDQNGIYADLWRRQKDGFIA